MNECHNADGLYAECHYAECHYAECHYAECRGAFKGQKKSFGKSSSGDRNNDKIRMKWGRRKIWGHHIWPNVVTPNDGKPYWEIT